MLHLPNRLMNRSDSDLILSIRIARIQRDHLLLVNELTPSHQVHPVRHAEEVELSNPAVNRTTVDSVANSATGRFEVLVLQVKGWHDGFGVVVCYLQFEEVLGVVDVNRFSADLLARRQQGGLFRCYGGDHDVAFLEQGEAEDAETKFCWDAEEVALLRLAVVVHYGLRFCQQLISPKRVDSITVTNDLCRCLGVYCNAFFMAVSMICRWVWSSDIFGVYSPFSV